MFAVAVAGHKRYCMLLPGYTFSKYTNRRTAMPVVVATVISKSVFVELLTERLAYLLLTM